MKHFYIFVFYIICFQCVFLFSSAQTTYLPKGSEELHLIDRLETFSGKLQPFTTSNLGFSRKEAARFFEGEQKNTLLFHQPINSIDFYNLENSISINSEWIETVDGEDAAIPSKRPILKYFYRTPSDFIHVNTPSFFLVVNPIIYTEGIVEKNDKGLKYTNVRGAEMRGRLLNKVGFYSQFSDDQERPFSYVNDWAKAHHAFPSMSYYVRKKNNYDMFMGLGYVDANFLNESLNVTFGYDKHFIGDGIRSLFLSDFGAPSTFLRLRWKLGKWSYQNLFTEGIADHIPTDDYLRPKKYMAFHKLDVQLTNWLRLGLFESTVIGKSKMTVPLFNPIILGNSLISLGDNSCNTGIGFDFKAIALKKFQLYGQSYWDRVDFAKLGKGSWKNQWAFQLGGKYFNMAGIANLDGQIEWNSARPFTYSGSDIYNNYTHYNQPLAHPLEASFSEWLAQLKYQPIKNLYIETRFAHFKRGVDTSALENFGNDIFKPDNTHLQNEGWSLISGHKVKGIYLNINAAYQINPRIFLEVGYNYLNKAFQNKSKATTTSSAFYGGLRWNFIRRQYDFF